MRRLIALSSSTKARIFWFIAGTFVVLAAVLFTFITPTDEDDSTTFVRSYDGQFSASFPGDLQETHNCDSRPCGQYVSTTSSGDTYSVSYEIYNPSSQTTRVSLEDELEFVRAESGGEVISKRNLTVQGHPAIDSEIQLNFFAGIQHVRIVHGRDATYIVSTRSRAQHPKKLEAFMDSFAVRD